MENTPNKHLTFKAAVLILVLAVVVAGGAYWWNGYQAQRAEREAQERPMNAETSITPFEDGILNPPENFPADVPLEGTVVESATTNFPDQKAVQTSVTLHSEVSPESKEEEYLSYLESAGYEVTESRGENGIVSLNGTKEGEMISVVISLWEEFTLVQIAHLDFSSN